MDQKTLNLQFISLKEREIWFNSLNKLKSSLESHNDNNYHHIDFISWQNIASKGVLFIKHGRYGTPNKKTIFIDCDNGCITWKSKTEQKHNKK